MRILDIIVTVLLIVGALNWGLVGLFGINLVGTLFGEATIATRVLYTLVGLGGLYEAYNVTFGYETMHHRWCDIPATVKH